MPDGSSATEQVSVVKPRTSNRIDEADARELRWYFGNPPIAGVFSESSFGAQLERAELFGLGGRPCTKCGGDRKSHKTGTGWATKSGKPYAAELKAFRKSEAKRLDFKGRGIRVCDAAAVDGWKRLGINAISPEQIASELPPRLVRPCPSCELSGWIPGRPRRRGVQTARPTGSSVTVGAREPGTGVDEQALARYGKLSRILEAVRNESALARAALEVFYRRDGGSIVDLAWLTPAGQEFVDRAPNPLGLTPETLLQNERDAQRSDPSTDRALVLGRIVRESTELWDHACQTWNLVTQ